MRWCADGWGVNASLRRRLGTFLHLVWVEKRQLRVVSLPENFSSWDVGMERSSQKMDVFSRWQVGWLPVAGTDLGLLLSRAGTPRGCDGQRAAFWQRTYRVCFGEWPVSWHLICESEKLHVSSSLEGFSQKMKYMNSVVIQQWNYVEMLCKRSSLWLLRDVEDPEGWFFDRIFMYCIVWWISAFQFVWRSLSYLFEVLLI